MWSNSEGHKKTAVLEREVEISAAAGFEKGCREMAKLKRPPAGERIEWSTRTGIQSEDDGKDAAAIAVG